MRSTGSRTAKVGAPAVGSYRTVVCASIGDGKSISSPSAAAAGIRRIGQGISVERRTPRVSARTLLVASATGLGTAEAGLSAPVPSIRLAPPRSVPPGTVRLVAAVPPRATLRTPAGLARAGQRRAQRELGLTPHGPRVAAPRERGPNEPPVHWAVEIVVSRRRRGDGRLGHGLLFPGRRRWLVVVGGTLLGDHLAGCSREHLLVQRAGGLL